MNRLSQLSVQATIVLALSNTTVSAQAPRGWNRCVGHESLDFVIEGCSEIIVEGQQAPAILALAHNKVIARADEVIE